MREKMSETEIAEVVTHYFQRQNWEIYPEVVLKYFGGRPDIIASRGTICQVIECKVNTNYQVIQQAMRWRHKHHNLEHGMPHLIWIAVQNNTLNSNPLLKEIVKNYGIGVIDVSKHYSYGAEKTFNIEEFRIGENLYYIREHIIPRIQPGSRKFGHRLIEQLNPDMRIAVPGSRGGTTEYMTPFKRTMSRVNSLMQDGKERHIKTILSGLVMMGGHHYTSNSSAENCIIQMCELAGCVNVGNRRLKLK